MHTDDLKVAELLSWVALIIPATWSRVLRKRLHLQTYVLTRTALTVERRGGESKQGSGETNNKFLYSLHSYCIQLNQSGCRNREGGGFWSWCSESLLNTNSSSSRQLDFCQNQLAWWGEKVDFGSFTSIAVPSHDYLHVWSCVYL